MPETTVNSAKAKIIAVIQQDPRKAGVLGALLLLLVLLLLRYLLSGSTVPSVAAAMGVMQSGQKSAPSAGAISGPRASSPVISWLARPAPALDRNLFAVKLELFPPDVTKSPSESAGEGFWAEIAKSLNDQADQQEKKHEMLLDLHAQASALRVTSVMMGPSPRAMINDKLVGEGDVVAEFRVLKIEARRIFVERAGIRLEIQMQ